MTKEIDRPASLDAGKNPDIPPVNTTSLFFVSSIDKVEISKELQEERNENIAQLTSTLDSILNKFDTVEQEAFRTVSGGQEASIYRNKRVTPLIPASNSNTDMEVRVQIKECINQDGKVVGHEVLYFEPDSDTQIGTTAAVYIVKQSEFKSEVFDGSTVEMPREDLEDALDFFHEFNDGLPEQMQTDVTLPASQEVQLNQE